MQTRITRACLAQCQRVSAGGVAAVCHVTCSTVLQAEPHLVHIAVDDQYSLHSLRVGQSQVLVGQHSVAVHTPAPTTASRGVVHASADVDSPAALQSQFAS
eukprot:13560-Heterococcus_DN1.PRE.1